MAKSRKQSGSAPLFEVASSELETSRPLADRLRPKALSEVIGQDHLFRKGGPLHGMLTGDPPRSTILWGPPGSGKTTVARLMAKSANLHFEQVSAIFSGVQELRKIFETACDRRRFGQGTVLFVDEIHRFNRAQQDSFLPHMEDGTIILLGATTENPSFEINSAVLSRAKVLVFKQLDDEALDVLLQRAESLCERSLPLTPKARTTLIRMAAGDGRALLNLAEDVFLSTSDGSSLSEEDLVALVQRRAPIYDKNKDSHYDLISALHKSVRGSDPNAALYWFSRMIDGGEDPLYLARRLVRMAVEDIGLADPAALVQANAAKDAYHFLGTPEGELALAQCVVYLATAPKSNAVYSGFKQAMRFAKENGSLPPPKHILNAPTQLMRDQGYGAGYQYDHDEDEAFSGQNYFPKSLSRQIFYAPRGYGFEKDIAEKLKSWAKTRMKKQADT